MGKEYLNKESLPMRLFYLKVLPIQVLRWQNWFEGIATRRCRVETVVVPVEDVELSKRRVIYGLAYVVYRNIMIGCNVYEDSWCEVVLLVCWCLENAVVGSRVFGRRRLLKWHQTESYRPRRVHLSRQGAALARALRRAFIVLTFFIGYAGRLARVWRITRAR